MLRACHRLREQNPMKIDFDAPILALDGTPMRDGENPATLKALACTALAAMFNDEPSLSATDKYQRFALGLKLVDGGEVDLSVEEIGLIKKLIGKAYPPVTMGRAYDLLDPKAKPASILDLVCEPAEDSAGDAA